MSLNYNLAKVKDHKTVCYLPDGDRFRMNVVTEALIWQSMAVGLDKVVEANLDDWFQRLAILSRIHGPMLDTAEGTRDATLDELKAHIGLTTNADALTWPQFLNNCSRVLKEHGARELRMAKQAQAFAVAGQVAAMLARQVSLDRQTAGA